MASLFRILKHKWIPLRDTTESFAGRCIIVTGSTSGIGLEAVAKFALLGAAKVIMAARDLDKGARVKASIEARTGSKNQLEVWELDLTSYESIQSFAERANALERLDIAILNAAIYNASFRQSRHGFEEDLQVNTLSTALLGILLLPKLKATRQISNHIPVLEFTNSGLHQRAKIQTDAIENSSYLRTYNIPEQFKANHQYSISKLFLMYATNTLAAQVSSAEVIITSICPGMVATNLPRDYKFPGARFATWLFGILLQRTAEQGARSIVSGTVLGESAHGRFWQHDELQPIGPSVAGDENRKIASQVWDEIVQVLSAQVPSPTSHASSSFFRFLFPHTRQRARAHLSKFRHETLRSLRQRTQSRIYRYILYRQAIKLKRKPGIIQRLRGHTRNLLRSNSSWLENEAGLRRQKSMKATGSTTSANTEMSYQEGNYAPREPGARRKKLAGYLKAANELRQTYQQQYASGWSKNQGAYEYEDDTPGSFPDAAVVRSGEEEMVLFPSYARKHVKRKPEAEPGTIQEVEGEGRDVRDSTGAGDAEFWKQQWDNYEDDNAVVDVDVRGWIYSPHKGQMSRKQRLFIGLARQLVGIQAPPAGSTPASSSVSPNQSREPSPGQLNHRDRTQIRQAQREELLTAKEAEEILKRGEREAKAAEKGAYSEKPAVDDDNTKLYRAQSRDSIRSIDSRGNLQPSLANRDENIKAIEKRASWNQPADMSSAELAEANARLMARLRHFLAIPMANTPISVFFYNEKISKQRTIYTNPSGHFSICAALDFVPTHVRILASDKLSATEEIIVTDPYGVSVISDIDDTIKHSAISSGAREIFRNAFIRELGDLTIEGVREWYTRMFEMGVKFHYVSNSPWQLFPVISKYFEMAGLPPGSFHLKQYSGMLQGIFEPVAERKKSTLDKIARDFPERSFILIGDSGEADLEVYTDFVLENPGRVVAVFIRDVTTTEGGGFFDTSVGPGPGGCMPSSQEGNDAAHRSASAANNVEDDDPHLRAAIEASLRDLEEDNKKRSKSLFPEIDDDHPDMRPKLPARKSSQAASESTPNLIDLSPDRETPTGPALRRVNTDTKTETNNKSAPAISSAGSKAAPPPPKKPTSLRSMSGDSYAPSLPASGKPPLPPKPRNSSSTVQQSTSSRPQGSPLRPQPGPKPTAQSQQTYAGMARDKLVSAYNQLPAASSYLPSSSSKDTHADSKPEGSAGGTKKAPPPPPPRRGVTAYPSAAASYVGSKATSAWQAAPALPSHLVHTSNNPNANMARANSYSTTASGGSQYPQRTNTSSTLGLNGRNGNQGTADGYGYAEQGMNKREALWYQRWARAEQILKDNGVTLKSWRIGTDVTKEAEKIIRDVAERNKEKAVKKGGSSK
ncbi:hypothetical protein BU24DRAFT_440345 [Aaosphaeria arxii CBS 175.79]|uniref:Phosphatidate phosphatase APP1 catalytic domain-containing protein n=1 Tax=Aaosphaeria arxii CBS 175.79 TaxID=1450172 RepID=A0A6A5XYJ5_9PLEO|nr:uncharacterized protein BU24DRAFT_440345 [Aaosphaeria arxii CBS 175.79]KAF2017344.1 hypothetical protein BU24DRAFT_440345 [Aaosphaeria arxii CBS 175.79]